MWQRIRRLLVLAYQCHDPGFAFGLLYGCLLRLRVRRCGRGLRLRASTVVRGARNIEIGDDFVSMGRLYMYADGDGSLQIGNNLDVNTNVQLGASAGRITIGNNVMIAANVVIRAATHAHARELPMKKQGQIRGAIVIEDDVWIGSNAVITSDVTLAKGTIVGAGSVVTRSTEPYSIVGGVPARKIGERS
jgi:galactoside O-acetyltransferase